MYRRVVAAAGVLAGAYACSSFESDAPSGSSDGGAPADASLDGNVTDAGIDADAKSAPPFCATDGGDLCEDFDDPGSATFTDAVADDGGTFSLETSQFVSPPKSAHFEFAPVSDPDAGCSNLGRKSARLIQAPDGFTVEYKVRLDAEISGSRALLGTSVAFGPATGDALCRFYLALTPPSGAQLYIEATDGSEYPALKRRPVPMQWSHVVIDYHGASSSRKVSVFIDEQEALLDWPVASSACQIADYVRELYLGLICVDSETGPLSAYFDDVRLKAH